MSGALEGRCVVITRTSVQNAPLRELLEERGATVLEVPLIEVLEPEDEGRERDEVLGRFERFDWVVITSPNGAERVAHFVAASHAAGDAATFPRFAVTGAATERALGVPAALRAEPARADVLAASFPVGSGEVLLVQGDLADALLADTLSAKGWTVTRVVAYRTVPRRPDDAVRATALAADVLLLASGSAARAWHDAFGRQAPPCVAVIGPSTASEADSLGIPVSAVALHQTLESLVDAAENALAPQ